MAGARTKIIVFQQDGTPVGEYLLGEGIHSIGRDPSSAIYLESDYVSSKHARLHLGATNIEIEDLNSTGGTYLDGVTVRGKLDIQPGQRLQLGDLLIDLGTEGSGELTTGGTLGAGRYTLVQELGRGAMGTVWLATDNELQEEIAIKLLAPELAGDAVTLTDLKREVQKSRKLSHENIIRIHDLSNLRGELPFITMEFIRGSNMDTLRLNQPNGLMSWKHLRPVVVQLAEALDYAHRQKIVHRDLKPANMMVTEDFTLKLADFGIAATLNDSTARSSLAGTVSGTLTYMSPQQLQGEDPRASDDIYSLGVTLYNLITGRPPFKSGDVRGQILNQSPTPLTQVLESAGVKSDIPDYVSSLVMACLAKGQEDRPQSGQAILEWIVTEGKSDLIAKKETSFYKYRPSQPGATPSTKQNKKMAALVALAVAVFTVAGLGWFFMGGAENKSPEAKQTHNQETIADTIAPGTLLWSFETEGDSVSSSPSIGADGTLYIGASDKKVYALDGKTGAKKWEFITKYIVHSSPAIGPDGAIFVGSADNKVYALHPDGTKKWEFKTGFGVGSSPAIGSDGTIYVGSRDNMIYALNPNGTKKWEFKTGDGVSSSPSIGVDGTVYIGSQDNKLYALSSSHQAGNGAAGAKKWEFLTGGKVMSSPAIGVDGTIYIGSNDRKLYALDGATGTKKWEFETGGYVSSSSPVIGSDGTVYVGSNDKKLYAIDPKSGGKLWEFQTEGPFYSSPAIGSDGTVYVGSSDHKVYALEGVSGAKKWEFVTGGEVRSSPSIGPDGTLYVGSHDGKIYAITTSSKGLAKSPWPMRGRNVTHSGRMTVKFGELYSKSQLEKDAADGDFLAQHLMGNYYRDGRFGFPQNYAQSIVWHKKSAEAGYVWAQFFTGLKYLNGNQGVKQDYAQALSWLEKAARQNFPQAMVRVGELHEEGKGTVVNEQIAYDWYNKAANLNEKAAFWHLGNCHLQGKLGQSIDFARAKDYYEHGAALGGSRSAFSLGVMYERGQGVPLNRKQATVWYLQSVRMGHGWAYHKMAQTLEEGWSGTPSIVGAYSWYAALATNKKVGGGEASRAAIKKIEELRPKMTPAQITQAQQIEAQIQTQIQPNK